jgi:hypothetical protein
MKPHGWRRHAPWLVPVALLFLSVLLLGLKWNSEVADPEFTDLQVPATVLPDDASPAAIGSDRAR